MRLPLPAWLVRFGCVSLIVGPLLACASEAIQPGVPRVIAGFAQTPFSIHEECVEMRPGDRLEYTFEATMPLAFNIHYHEGKAVVMPISRDSTRTEAGIYAPSIPQTYCLMWEAGREGNMLDYRVRFLPVATK